MSCYYKTEQYWIKRGKKGIFFNMFIIITLIIITLSISRTLLLAKSLLFGIYWFQDFFLSCVAGSSSIFANGFLSLSLTFRFTNDTLHSGHLSSSFWMPQYFFLSYFSACAYLRLMCSRKLLFGTIWSWCENLQEKRVNQYAKHFS